MTRHVAFVACLLVSACSPTLADGRYGCPDGNCPSPLMCWSDGLCHYGTESSTDSGAETDAFMMMPGTDGGGGGTCSSSTIGTCTGTDMCVVGAWVSPMPPTYRCASVTDIMNAQHSMVCVQSSSICTIPDACIGFGGTFHCLRPCGPPSDPCDFGEECVTLGTMSDPHVCAAPCGSGEGICHGQLECISGHCLPTGW